MQEDTDDFTPNPTILTLLHDPGAFEGKPGEPAPTVHPDRCLGLPGISSVEEAGDILEEVQQALKDLNWYFDLLPGSAEHLVGATQLGIFVVGDTGALEPRGIQVERSGWKVLAFGLPFGGKGHAAGVVAAR